MKLQTFTLTTFLKTDSNTNIFLYNCATILKNICERLFLYLEASRTSKNQNKQDIQASIEDSISEKQVAFH